MKNEDSKDSNTIIRLAANGPTDEYGNPLILPFASVKKRVVYLDSFLHRKTRAYQRLGCYGAVVLSNIRGQIVAAGKMRDISEKNVGFLATDSQIEKDEILFIEFMSHGLMGLNQMKVIVKRVQQIGHRKVVGVEFLNQTRVFQKRLDKFLDEIRQDRSGFAINEII